MVEMAAPDEVESDDCLWEKLVPEGKIEGGIGATKARNEFIFEGADGALGSITAMNVWGERVGNQLLHYLDNE